MKTQEAIENLKYLISGDCTDSHMDFVEEIEMAINALEQQLPKRPIARKVVFKSFNYECQRCKSRIISKIDGEWVAGKKQHYCDACGQALLWGDHPNLR